MYQILRIFLSFSSKLHLATERINEHPFYDMAEKRMMERQECVRITDKNLIGIFKFFLCVLCLFAQGMKKSKNREEREQKKQ